MSLFAVTVLPLHVPAQSGQFVATGSLSGPRTGPAATQLTDGRVLVVAGGTVAAELYDPATGTFSATGSMIYAAGYREYHTATLLADGKVLIAGGDICQSGWCGVPTAGAELYDPTTGTFSATGSMGIPRTGHTATLLRNGKVLIAGGMSWDGTFPLTPYSVAGAEVYDPSTGTFTQVGDMNAVRNTHTATLLPDGRVLVTGGSTSTATAELYDPVSGVFSGTGSMSIARLWPTATLLPGGKVLVAGGLVWTFGYPPRWLPTSTAELYDPVTATFSSASSMVAARSSFVATLMAANGKVLVVGGYQPGTTSAEEYGDPQLCQ